MIKVITSGVYTSVQDLGRISFQIFGVPISGVMDAYSATLANLILNNSPNCSVLEIALAGPKLEFTKPTNICITGANMSPKINDTTINMNSSVPVTYGDVLSFGKIEYGCRTYMAISNGIQTSKIIESRSMYEGITPQFRLSKGDELEYITSPPIKTKTIVKTNLKHFSNPVLEVYKGPEYNLLDDSAKEYILQNFTISKFNSRMAYQLDEVVPNSCKPILSAPVLPGTVQLTPKGNLIVLMRDAQTTGGYPRVLQLTENAINILAQKSVGCHCRFEIISP